ncbi:hypothetical protein [Nocardia carnea]|uniref:hypothetical protein n=1 Tax=Nocardia carnea TaxID=37328 RepID=UPI002456C6F3|nr:hypothetical protein [Nocardia carnea]
MYIWRLVVDFYPTENGAPFSAQDVGYWEDIAHAYQSGKPLPAWLPDLAPWLPGPPVLDPWLSGPVDVTSARSAEPEKPGYMIGDGDDGSPYGLEANYHHIMNVPSAPTRRYFSRAPLDRRLADLLAWGCVAYIERAEVGEWERQ